MCVSTSEFFPPIPLAPRKMPTTVSIVYTLFKLEELSEEAKAKALEDFCRNHPYPWYKEDIASLEAFCDCLAVDIVCYSIGDIRGLSNWVWTDLRSDSFRGLKFNEFNFEQMPTGYWMDSTLFKAFQKYWEETGSECKAFQNAIDDFLIAVNRNVEHYLSVENLTRVSEANKWTYLADGKLFLPDNTTIIPSH